MTDPTSGRDELAALIYPYFGTPDGDFDALNAADAILARWRLVPVEQHEHVRTEQRSSKDWEGRGAYWIDKRT